MSIYVRTSISVGPFRCGLSRSGLSVSTAVPGLRGVRVGAGPRGAFVRVGAAGVHSYLTAPPARPAPRRSTGAYTGSAGLPMQDITGARIAALLPAHPSDLVEKLNTAARWPWLWPWVLGAALLLAALVSPWTLVAGVPAALAVAWNDRVRRTVVAFYEVDGTPGVRYAELVERFAGVVACRAAWQRTASGTLDTTHQRKVHAGASELAERVALRRSLSGPRHLASNIAVPTLTAGSRSIHLLPDRALVQEGSRYVEIGYDELRVVRSEYPMVETGPVPPDATVVGTTWRFVNKDGGPDRRFNNNCRLPVVRYAEVVLHTWSGMYTALLFSREDAARRFVSAVGRMRDTTP